MPRWTAPELLSRLPYDARVDVFSFGMLVRHYYWTILYKLFYLFILFIYSNFPSCGNCWVDKNRLLKLQVNIYSKHFWSNTWKNNIFSMSSITSNCFENCVWFATFSCFIGRKQRWYWWQYYVSQLCCVRVRLLTSIFSFLFSPRDTGTQSVSSTGALAGLAARCWAARAENRPTMVDAAKLVASVCAAAERKQQQVDEDNHLCTVCLDEPRCMAFVPCGKTILLLGFFYKNNLYCFS